MTTATVLPWGGGEMGSFDPLDANSVEVTSFGTYDPAWARCALEIVSGSNGVTSPKWPVANDFWWHGRLLVGANNAGLSISDGVDFYDNGVIVAALRLSQAIHAVSSRHELFTSQTGVLTSVGFVDLLQSVQEIDIQIVAGGSGSAALYSSGSQIFSVSGLNHAFSGIDQIKLGGSYGISTVCDWSEIICDSISHIGDRLFTYDIDTDSAINAGWTGNVNDVNEVVYNDANFISAATAGLISTFYQNGLNLGVYNILAVLSGIRAKTGTTSPQNLANVIRVAGGNYPGPTIALSPGFQACCHSWTTNPSSAGGTGPWVAAAAQTVENGPGSIT